MHMQTMTRRHLKIKSTVAWYSFLEVYINGLYMVLVCGCLGENSHIGRGVAPVGVSDFYCSHFIVHKRVVLSTEQWTKGHSPPFMSSLPLP